MKKWVDMNHIVATATADENKGNLYLGSMSVLRNMEQLKNTRIGCVLSIMEESNYITYHIKEKIMRNKIDNYHHINLADSIGASILPQLRASSEYIRQNLEKTNVFVHCQAGRSRSASIVIAFLMKEKELSRDIAADYVKSKRNEIAPNPKFWEELLQWQKQLNI